MTPIDTLHRIALNQGIGIRRCGPSHPDRFDLVNSADDSLIARELTLDEVGAVLLGDLDGPALEV